MRSKQLELAFLKELEWEGSACFAATPWPFALKISLVETELATACCRRRFYLTVAGDQSELLLCAGCHKEQEEADGQAETFWTNYTCWAGHEATWEGLATALRLAFNPLEGFLVAAEVADDIAMVRDRMGRHNG